MGLLPDMLPGYQPVGSTSDLATEYAAPTTPGLDMLEIFEDRHGARSTIVTSQLPVETWHDYVADPTIADALLDRVVHNAHRLKLKGPSKRKTET